MSLRLKMWILTSLIVIGLLVIMLVGLFTLRYATNADNEARVEQLLNSTYAIVAEMEQLAANGELTEEQAKSLATSLLRNNKYHESEYVYVADESLNFIATPLEPELHGTSFHEFKDSNGNSVGDILLAATQKSGNGLAKYTWSLGKADGTVEEKLSIAKQSPRWQWVVGTGIGFNEANARFWDSATKQLLICLLVSLLIVIPVHLSVNSIQRGLGSELNDVLRLVRKVADGDLRLAQHREVPEQSIYGSVQRMVLSLREMMSGIANSVTSLHHISDQIVEKAELSTKMSEQQSLSTIKIASSAEEFNQQTKHAMHQAIQARDQTNLAAVTSAQGQQLIIDTLNRFQEIERSVLLTQNSIDELAQRIHSISAVISVISEVANQTNLLALNAAIEAARAGDQGRGFAVVADEVRQLASRTSQATQEISDTITSVQAGSQTAKQNMDQMVHQLKGGIEQTKDTGEIVETINRETRSVENLVSHIGQAMSEHVEASGLILQYVSHVEESSISAKNAAQGTLDASEKIRDASDQLHTLLNRFHL